MDFKSLSDLEAAVFAEESPRLIFDVGACRGETAVAFLDRFPHARLVAFEPEPINADHARTALWPYRDRARLESVALSDRPGAVDFHLNSHPGTHSLHQIGAQRYWAGHASAQEVIRVPATTLDDYCARHGIDAIDILKLDTQGSELSIMMGGAGLLGTERIAMIRCEVEIYPLYAGQPLFHDVTAFLDRFGYKLAGLQDPYYHEKNPAVLSWFDAIYVAPRLTAVPEWVA